MSFKHPRHLRTVFLLLCFALWPAPPPPSSTAARYPARVKDPQGGVVPGATVVGHQSADAAQFDRGDRPRPASSPFPNLSSGSYTISTEFQGFKKSVRPDVLLDAAASVSIDFTLETGALTESVTVTAATPVLQTDTALRKTDRIEGHRAAVVQRAATRSASSA